MHKKKKFDPNAQMKKIERIKKYYASLNEDEEKVKKYVREKTMEWLAESDKTRFQIEEKIYKNIDKKHESIVSEILEYYEECNYLNDDRFVENFIRMKFNSYDGRTKINKELKKRGINPELYEDQYDDYDFQESVIEYVKNRTEGKELTNKEIDSFKTKLINKGFSFGEVSNALPEIKKKQVVYESKEDLDEYDLVPATQYIEKQMRKGYGLQRIRTELKHKGLIHTEEMFEDFDFYEAALNYKIKKYGEEKETDYNIINKRKQHMLSRGFNFDEISEAMS